MTLDDEEQPDILQARMAEKRALSSITAPKELLNDIPGGPDDDVDPFAATRRQTIEERQSEYHKRRQRVLSPERVDAFAATQAPSEDVRTYAEVIRETELEKERQAVLRAIQQKRKEAEEAQREAPAVAPDATPIVDSGAARKKRRWDMTPVDVSRSEWDDVGTSDASASRCAGRSWHGRRGENARVLTQDGEVVDDAFVIPDQVGCHAGAAGRGGAAEEEPVGRDARYRRRR